MSFKEIQGRVDEWTSQFENQYWEPHQILARLIEEVGELGREINDRFGPKKRKATEGEGGMGDEMADIIFTLICLANSQDIDLGEAFDGMMDKIEGRDSDRYDKKE